MIGSTTKSLYFNNGQYSKERLAIHDEIISELTAGYDAAAGRPTSIFLGGGTASGKSSLSELLKQSFKDENQQVLVIDSDFIKAKLPEYQELQEQDPELTAAKLHDESSDISEKLYYKCLDDKINIIFDGTMKNTEKYNRFIDQAKQNGYEVSVVIADVPLDEAIRRADRRFMIEQRRVPLEIITESHKMVPVAFYEIKEKLDSFYLYDTFERHPMPFYVKSNDQIKLLDEVRLAEFYDKSGLELQEMKQLEQPQPLVDLLKQLKGLPTGNQLTSDLMNNKVTAFSLEKQGKVLHYKLNSGQIGSLKLQQMPYMSETTRNQLLDSVAAAVKKTVLHKGLEI